MWQRAPWRMLLFMDVQVSLSSMDLPQMHMVPVAALGLTNCSPPGQRADQYRRPEWSPDKQLMNKWKRYCLQPYPISRGISITGLKGSFPFQGDGDEQLCTPELEANVLETYFYYLRMLNRSGMSLQNRGTPLCLSGA